MLQIPCPWCGVRDEDEFATAANARHTARPRLRPTRPGADYLFNKDNPKGVHAERWRHAFGCGQWFNLVGDTVTHEVIAVYRHGEPKPRVDDGARVSGAPGGLRLARGGQHRPRPPARVHLSTGGATTGFAGDTLASALLANGVRIVGAQLQGPPAARHLLGGHRGDERAIPRRGRRGRSMPLVRATLQPLIDGLGASSEHAWPSVASTSAASLDYTHLRSGRPASTTRRSCGRAGTGRAGIRRAAGSGRVPDEPTRRATPQHNLHCDLLVVGGGPPGLRGATAAGAGGAWSCCRTASRDLGGSLLGDEVEIDRTGRRDWVEAASRNCAAAANVRVLADTTVAGALRPRHLRRRRSLARACAGRRRSSGSGSSARSRSCSRPARSSSRSSSTTTTGRASCSPGAVRALLRAIRRRRRAPRRRRDEQRRRVPHGVRAARRRCRGAGDRRCARVCRLRRSPLEAKARALELIGNSVISDTRYARRARGQRRHAVFRRTSVVAAAGHSLRRIGGFRRLEPDGPPVLAGRRQAALRRGARLFRAGPAPARRLRVVGAANGSFALAQALIEGATAGADAATSGTASPARPWHRRRADLNRGRRAGSSHTRWKHEPPVARLPARRHGGRHRARGRARTSCRSST